MRQLALVSLALATLGAGCKTPGTARSGVLESSGGGSGLYCAFPSPNGTGEKHEIWATPSDGSKLVDVKDRYTPEAGEESTQVNEIGTAPAVDESKITQGGKLGLRGFSKDEMQVDFRRRSCFAVESKTDRAGYLCLPRDAADKEALWITNIGVMKFVTDLTVFSAECGAPKT